MGDVLMLSVSGCRGVMGTSLTGDVALRFAAGFAAWLGGQRGEKAKGRVRVALGRDGRRGSEVYSGLVRAALVSRGCDVLDLDIAMTPTVGVMVDALGLDGGLVVTASHNPQPWCGLKPVVRMGGGKAGKVVASAPGKVTAAEIIGEFERAKVPLIGEWTTLGSTQVEPLLGHRHGAWVREALGPAMVKKLAGVRAKVVVDNLGMSGAAMSDWALKWLMPKARIEQMYAASWEDERAEKRGVFPHAAEPTRENLKGLARAVRARKAAVGFAQDPDADRLAIVDEKGRYIGEEYTLVLAAMALGEMGLIGKGSKIAVNLSTSRMIEDVAAGFGAKVLRTAVGEANVVEGMKREKCVLGGEGNGGVIWPRVTYIRDSLSAMALVMGLCARTKRSVGELVERVPSYAIVKRKVDLASKEQAGEAVEAVAKAFGGKVGAKVDRQDGVWVGLESERAWLHVRASNTEPIMRLIAEGPSAKVAEGLLAEAGRVIANG